MADQGIKSGNFLINMGPIVFIVPITLLAMIIVALVYVFKRFRRPIQKKLKKVKRALVWNGVIRLVTLSYLKYCVAVNAAIRLGLLKEASGTELFKRYELYVSALAVLILGGYPYYCHRALTR